MAQFIVLFTEAFKLLLKFKFPGVTQREFSTIIKFLFLDLKNHGFKGNKAI